MLKKLIKKISLRKYEPKKFWDDWAAEFMKDPWQVKVHSQHQGMLKIIRRENPISILEVGCGFGRNIKFLIENGVPPSKITGFDISSRMIGLAQKYVNNNNVKLYTSDLSNFKTEKKFDLVFTHGVLMHIPEDKIKDAVSRLVKLSKHGLILIEQNYEADNNYTFVHNYRELLNSRKVDIIEYKSDEKLGLDLIYAEVR